MDEFVLVRTDYENKWDEFIDNSRNGTIFSKIDYLKAINANPALYYCYKNKELKAAVALIESQDGNNVILHDFIIYNGIIYCTASSNQNHSQVLSEEFKIQTFIAEELLKKYDRIEISLHPTIKDVRPFLWVNYGTNLPKYSVEVKYTSYVSIKDFAKADKLEDISIYNKASVSRRQQVRYAIKKKYETKIVNDYKSFVEFYRITMQRQDIIIDENNLGEMEYLISILIEKDMANIFVSYDEHCEPGSMALFGWDSKRAYYIFGANDPAKRDGHSGTSVMWDAFAYLSKKGVSEVDLEGINSPYRGWFKLSFGGDIINYYQVFKTSKGKKKINV